MGKRHTLSLQDAKIEITIRLCTKNRYGEVAGVAGVPDAERVEKKKFKKNKKTAKIMRERGL